MTEPTDAAPLTVIDLMRVVMDADNETRGFALRGSTNWAAHIGKAVQNAVLAKWGTPPAVAKWAPEEIADGERGIRWVTNDGIHGRPTDHDVREYLKRTPTAHGCHCDECKQFYTAQQPTQAQAGAVPLTHDEALDAFCHTPGIHQFVQAFMAGVRFAEQHHGIGIKGGQHGAE